MNLCCRCAASWAPAAAHSREHCTLPGTRRYRWPPKICLQCLQLDAAGIQCQVVDVPCNPTVTMLAILMAHRCQRACCVAVDAAVR